MMTTCRHARELLDVALARHVLRALELALLFEHPTLDRMPDPPEPATLRRARTLRRSCRRLRADLRRYRLAVLDAVQPPPADSVDRSLF